MPPSSREPHGAKLGAGADAGADESATRVVTFDPCVEEVGPPVDETPAGANAPRFPNRGTLESGKAGRKIEKIKIGILKF